MNSDLHENRSEQEIIGKLSTLDRYLPLWIVIAMALGLILGRVIPSLQNALDSVKIDGTSLLIAIGLFAMMYPVLARVKYEEMGHLTGDRKMLWLSLILNWVVGPLFMFALAWIFLADQPAFRTGLIVIGLARCIAMVLIWNDLACGDREAGALLVSERPAFEVSVIRQIFNINESDHSVEASIVTTEQLVTSLNTFKIRQEIIKVYEDKFQLVEVLESYGE